MCHTANRCMPKLRETEVHSSSPSTFIPQKKSAAANGQRAESILKNRTRSSSNDDGLKFKTGTSVPVFLFLFIYFYLFCGVYIFKVIIKNLKGWRFVIHLLIRFFIHPSKIKVFITYSYLTRNIFTFISNQIYFFTSKTVVWRKYIYPRCKWTTDLNFKPHFFSHFSF